MSKDARYSAPVNARANTSNSPSSRNGRWSSRIGLVGCLIAAAASNGQGIHMEVNASDASSGVYLCWAPVQASISLEQPGTVDIPVSLSSAGTPGLVFQSGPPPPRSQFAPAEVLDITLPKSGAPVTLTVTAKWTDAHDVSAVADDMHLVVRSQDLTLAQFPVSVRVRRNVETLTADERGHLLNALAIMQRMGWFDRYAAIHHAAGPLVHSDDSVSRSVFLAWHRALLLDLERRLQEIDPSVALPYWDFTAAAPSLFSPDFLGAVADGTSEVSFSKTNPLRDFRVKFGFDVPFDAQGPLRRNPTNRLATAGVITGANLDYALKSIANAPNYPVANELIQKGFHAAVHGLVGYYMAVPDTAAVDPLFFLLHANVDRQWAHWEETPEARESADTDTGYSPRGKFTQQCCQPRTAFADEPIWPWNIQSAAAATGTTLADDPPDNALRLSFPAARGHSPAGPEPLVKEMVDYLGTKGETRNLGYCYDDLHF